MIEKIINNTEKIYEKDATVIDFEATVIGCSENNGAFRVILDKTAFFPTGGGQSCDTGSIENSRVSDVFIENGKIIHITDKPLDIGQRVKCNIDANERYEKMRSHTAEHILSSYIFKTFGFKNVGFHLGSVDTTCDFDGWLSSDMLSSAEAYVNRVIMENHEVYPMFPQENELSELSYRSKLDLEGEIRIVCIGNNGEIDLCACCAPHVKRTGQIGYFKIVDAYSYKGGMRIHILAGEKAVSRAKSEHNGIKAISELLSAKPYASDVISAVERVMNELAEVKNELNNTRTALSFSYCIGVKKDEGFAVHIDKPDGDLVKKIAICAKNRGASTAFAVGGEGDVRFAIVGERAFDIFSALKTRFSARGGGKDVICGSFSYDGEFLAEDFLKEHV